MSLSRVPRQRLYFTCPLRPCSAGAMKGSFARESSGDTSSLIGKFQQRSITCRTARSACNNYPVKGPIKGGQQQKRGIHREALIFDTPIKRGQQGDTTASRPIGQSRKPSTQAISRYIRGSGTAHSKTVDHQNNKFK